jgi:hypothetical protein
MMQSTPPSRPSDVYRRHYPSYIVCELCGELTRGRVYENRREVHCGSCTRVLTLLDAAWVADEVAE